MESNSVENSNSSTATQAELTTPQNSSNRSSISNQDQKNQDRTIIDKVDISEQSTALSRTSKQQSQKQTIIQDSSEKTSQEKVKEESIKSSKQALAENEIDNLSLTPRSLQFKFNEIENPDTGEIRKELVVHIKNLKTGELIRTVPPENIFEEIKKFPPDYPQLINRLI